MPLSNCSLSTAHPVECRPRPHLKEPLPHLPRSLQRGLGTRYVRRSVSLRPRRQNRTAKLIGLGNAILNGPKA